MKVIILTQYYPPETGAPQNRLHSLAGYLKANSHVVNVVTAMPSYPQNRIYEGYRGRFALKEVVDSIDVHRTWIFVSESKRVFARLLNYFSFALASFFKLVRLPRADFIICESPPLFLGITAVLIARIKKSKLVFNVSDLWPESAEKLEIVSNKTLLRLAYRLERWIYINAFLISGQTKGIVSNINSRFPDKNTIWFPNGVDIDFFGREHEKYDWRREWNLNINDFVLLYAGIIGHAQGLEVILKAARKLRDIQVKFVIVGDGPEKNKLTEIANKQRLTNILFYPNVKKEKIPSLINVCDAYIVPLKKLDLFKGAVPSKLFEPAAMGKPIVLGVEGEAKELFIDEGKIGLFFEPENEDELTSQIRVLYSDQDLAKKLGRQGMSYVKSAFDRNKIHENFLTELVTTTN